MQSIQDINREIQSCKRCDLFFSRKRAVCGTGNPEPSIMIIGEAPGSREDETGIPFVGRSGKLLRDVLKIAGIDVEKIYISNAVRCRPKIGRSPKISEIKKCSNFLRTEIGLLNPRILVPMGNSSLRSIKQVLGVNLGPISESEGNIFSVDGRFIAPQFHPAAILRNPKRYERFKDNFLTLSQLSEKMEKMELREIQENYHVKFI